MYTKETIESQSKCKVHLIARDIGYEHNCRDILDAHLNTFGSIDILINNAAEQHKVNKIEDIVGETMERTFRTNGMYIYISPHVPPPLSSPRGSPPNVLSFGFFVYVCLCVVNSIKYTNLMNIYFVSIDSFDI